ncbi:MAG: DUF5698 domain-containing protein [Candidatus Hodarchaeaceae archaeon]|nr:DUF5698 domain-containing protein [Candidatus Hodarchaeaceae archaeon]
MSTALLGSLLIFLARMTDVSMGTLRQIMIIRGQRKIGAVIGFFEIMLWAAALSQVLPQLSVGRIHYLLAFALGFSAGNFLGSLVEEKIALGYTFAYVVPKNRSTDLGGKFRKAGFGVTTIWGVGLDGPKPLYNIVFRRKDTRQFLNILKRHDRGAFYTVMDVKSESGGFIRGVAKKK